MELKLEQIITDVLIAFGYDAVCNENQTHYAIVYTAFDQYIPKEVETVVRIIAGDKLMEFFWMSSKQTIYISK